MKFTLAIAALSMVALASAAPTANQTDKEKVVLYATNALTFAKQLLGDFPKSPENVTVKKAIAVYERTLAEIKLQTVIPNIVDVVGTLAVTDAEMHQLNRSLRHPGASPQNDKNKLLSYAANVLSFAQDLLAQFPSAPASHVIREEIAKITFRQQIIQESAELSNLVDTVAPLVLSNEKLAKIEHHLRFPEIRPQDDQTMVHSYALNVLKYGETLLKEIGTVPEAKEVESIIADLKLRLKEIESTYELSNIVETGAILGIDNYKLVAIAKKLGKHTP